MFCHTEPLEKRIITTLVMRVKLLKKQQRYQLSIRTGNRQITCKSRQNPPTSIPEAHLLLNVIYQHVFWWVTHISWHRAHIKTQITQRRRDLQRPLGVLKGSFCNDLAKRIIFWLHYSRYKQQSDVKLLIQQNSVFFF